MTRPDERMEDARKRLTAWATREMECCVYERTDIGVCAARIVEHVQEETAKALEPEAQKAGV